MSSHERSKTAEEAFSRLDEFDDSRAQHSREIYEDFPVEEEPEPLTEEDLRMIEMNSWAWAQGRHAEAMATAQSALEEDMLDQAEQGEEPDILAPKKLSMYSRRSDKHRAETALFREVPGFEEKVEKNYLTSLRMVQPLEGGNVRIYDPKTGKSKVLRSPTNIRKPVE